VGPNPTDRAKGGAKRSLLTDGAGIPLGIVVDGANRNDFQLLGPTIESIPIPRPRPTKERPQGLCLDKGYDYAQARDTVKHFRYTPHIRSRGEEQREQRRSRRHKARRWVVERTHSWLNRHRSILVRWAKKAENYVGLLHFACALVAFRASGLFG